MKLDINIKNFGKINNADIQIRPFTVIAGVNSSGKSFVTKALYSFFSAINRDYISIEVFNVMNEISNINAYINEILLKPSQSVSASLDLYFLQLKAVEELFKESRLINFISDQISNASLLKKEIETLENLLAFLEKDISTASKYLTIGEQLVLIREQINQLKKIVHLPSGFFLSGVYNEFINNLKDNFQVSNFNDLKNYHVKHILDEFSIDSNFDFDSLGKLVINEETHMYSLSDENNSIDEFRRINNIIYIESPVYWKLLEPLISAKDNKQALGRSHLKKVEYLTGVPGHFYDLVDLLKNDIKNIEKHEHEQDAIKTAIGGELLFSKLGNKLYFKEKGCEKDINLHATALGIINLGIITLLLEKGILAEGSFLFVDEPEAHLHPNWQKILVETLFELSKKGINIIMASHSIDMMKCVELIMENEDELVKNGHFGINQLSAEGNSITISDNVFKRIAAIMEDLGESFNDMFLNSKWN